MLISQLPSEMKVWQYGYDIKLLKEYESMWKYYNDSLISPFAKMKKNNIAQALHEKTLYIERDSKTNRVNFMINMSTAKVRSPIKMYSNSDVVIGMKEKGDIVINGFVPFNSDFKLRYQLSYLDKDAWSFCPSDYIYGNNIMKEAGFTKIGVKISSFSDIINVYYKGKPRQHPLVDSLNYLGLAKVKVKLTENQLPYLQRQITENKLLDAMKNHYSNYNKDNAWSALSLRGYSNDPTMIEKPSEMPKKWQEEHKDVKYELQDTKLRDYFEPVLSNVLNHIRGGKVQRIRLMKLAPNQGELERHTDQVDPDSGVEDGKYMRIHIPIFTNPDVRFTVWNVNGEPEEINMKEGEIWYLDTRKPHRAINGGTTERIHLVMDVESTPQGIRYLV